MSYTATAEVKGYLDITATDYDTIIGKAVADADVVINSALDIDGFSAWTKTELIQRKDVSIYSAGFYSFILKNFNVLTITHLNGVAYTGTKALTADYYVTLGRKVLIKNLEQEVSESVDNFGFFEVTYTYWYASLPTDIALLAKLIAAVKFRENYPNYTTASTGDASMANVAEYQLADEKVKFNTSWEKNRTDQAEIERILAKYRKPHVLS